MVTETRASGVATPGATGEAATLAGGAHEAAGAGGTIGGQPSAEPLAEGFRATYAFADETPTPGFGWISPAVLRLIRPLPVRSVLDVGCGNGNYLRLLSGQGYAVTGVEPEATAVEISRRHTPGVDVVQAGVYDDAATVLGQRQFDLVMSIEVIEHLYLPRALPRFAHAALRPGGYLLISTPYHGYLSNLGLALLNRWDVHHAPHWDGGHVKFWSRQTLSRLLDEAGFDVLRFRGAGHHIRRLPYFWNTMLLLARKR